MEISLKPVDEAMSSLSNPPAGELSAGGNPLSNHDPALLNKPLDLSAVWPLCVFNFHHVEATTTKIDRKHITITPEGLRRFIRTVRRLGFTPVSLKALYHDPKAYAHVKNGRFCLITFDDGLLNNLTYALPVLTQEQCPATIFALPGKLGGTNDWDEGHLPTEHRDALMTGEQMKTMAHSPFITFASHGLYHSHLGTLPQQDVLHELVASHHTLQALMPNDYVPAFAYPWGEYTAETLACMTHADSPYAYAFTTENGMANATHNPMTLPRYSVFYRDANPLVLTAKLYRHGLITWWGKLKPVTNNGATH
jgi:peptidoglycan/xylan/chitin deacetylase (PgdA/CDA1 family)